MLLRALVAVSLLASGCHKDPDVEVQHPKSGDLPPLPPSSGTPVGYLIDNQAQLALTGDQLAKLQQIDRSLAAQNDALETQIRSIEVPEEEEPDDPKNPQPKKPANHAPGVHTKSTPDSKKLHAAVDANTRDALTRVFKLLDPKQLETAKRILDERGIVITADKKPKQPDEAGTPLPGTEQGEP